MNISELRDISASVANCFSDYPDAEFSILPPYVNTEGKRAFPVTAKCGEKLLGITVTEDDAEEYATLENHTGYRLPVM